MNCRNYDIVWLNCVLLGFDGIRENPNMRCNVELEVNGQRQFAFIRRTAEEEQEEQALAEKLRGDEPISLR